ncbi:MAG: type I-E CRISPR-associated protein Cas7/Cse4/CasC [Synergistaceae bacterium]|nr:type I-E CRISPR-associated protein Cas7/Cse4/CasC [Synergistaceae bacterium]
MVNKRLYVDFHVIQTVPPSCVNRDDTGRPKTAFYGGVNRARVSSQSWKHAVREMFKDIFADEKLGFRTLHAVDLLADKLSAQGYAAEKAQKSAVDAIKSAGVSVKDKDNTTGALFFISAKQLDGLAELVLNGEKDKKKYKEALLSQPSIDMALFGRMVADDAELNVDASCQVAHSISTHSVEPEYDFFTATDDCSPADNAGAGHLGTLEFNSSTLYRYATVNVMDLFKAIGSDVSDAVAGFARAFICSMPTGKQNSYANRTLPDLIYVTVREDQPVNLSGAFEEPVKGHDGFVEKSKSKLFAYADKVYANYCGKPKFSYVVDCEEVERSGVERTNLDGLLKALLKVVSEEVQ